MPISIGDGFKGNDGSIALHGYAYVGNRACRMPAFRYIFRMTTAVAHIIGEVGHLTHSERIELRRHIVEHTPMSNDLTDDDFTALAATSFRALDEEEAQRA